MVQETANQIKVECRASIHEQVEITDVSRDSRTLHSLDRPLTRHTTYIQGRERRMYHGALAIRIQVPRPVVVAKMKRPNSSFWSSLPPTSLNPNT